MLALGMPTGFEWVIIVAIILALWWKPLKGCFLWIVRRR
jgi:hypothetical protein